MQSVQMLTDVVGPTGVWRENEIHELTDDMAKAWVENGQARAVKVQAPPAARRETARPPATRSEKR